MKRIVQCAGVFLVAALVMTAGWASADGGAICAGAPVINVPADLPYNDPGTTCGKGQNYQDNACLSSYDNGEDAVYEINVTVAGTYSFALSGTDTYTGFFVTDGCPDVATTCTGYYTNSGGNPSGNITFPSAGTYFLQIDTWPSPACTVYTLDITAPAAAPTNDDCAGAVSDPASFGIDADGLWPDSTVGSASNAVQLTDGSAACGYTTSTHANDVVYFFDVTNGAGDITLAMENATFDATLWVVTDCSDPDNTVVACSDGGNPETVVLAGLADGRYYVICDGWGTATGIFDLTATGSSLPVELHRFIVK